jgi:hypothetical protein
MRPAFLARIGIISIASLSLPWCSLLSFCHGGGDTHVEFLGRCRAGHDVAAGAEEVEAQLGETPVGTFVHERILSPALPAASGTGISWFLPCIAAGGNAPLGRADFGRPAVLDAAGDRGPPGVLSLLHLHASLLL